jgi:hypothetical protein
MRKRRRKQPTPYRAGHHLIAQPVEWTGATDQSRSVH